MDRADRGRSRGGGRVKEENASRSRSRSRSRVNRDRSPGRPANARLADKRVYISNIPYDSRWQDIKDLFRKEVGEVSFVELFTDENDKPRGCGVIELENAATAKKAIEKMHRFEMAGRKIVVKEDYDVERDKTGRIITGSNRNKEERGGGGGPGGDRDRSRDRVVILRDRPPERDWDQREEQGGSQGFGKFENTFGLSQQFLESLGVEGQLIPKVFVSNLDFRVDEKKLKEVFRLAGRVLEVDLNRDKDGKSRGHGVIEFEHPVEAVQAISMFNNQQLYERRMHVKMDRLADPLADLAKNRLPEGLKTIGMGLGVNGQPLVDVSRNLPSGNSNTSLNNVIGTNNAAAQNQASNNLASSMNTLAALNVNPAFGNLASLMSNPQGLDALGSIGSSNAALANAFGAGLTGMNPMGALNNPGGQFGNLGGANANTLAAAMQNVGGLTGMQGNHGMGNNPMSLMGNPGAQIGTSSGISGGGGVSTPNNQQSPFQTNQAGAGQTGGSGLNMRDDYGYSTSVYSAPTNNFGQNQNKPFGNGVGGGNVNVNTGGQGQAPNPPSNTVIVANLPPSCTWQMLKTKFRECGDVVFAEMRDKSTGIVRFATERDAERAVKVFDQSRVDGRIVEVRFL